MAPRKAPGRPVEPEPDDLAAEAAVADSPDAATAGETAPTVEDHADELEAARQAMVDQMLTPAVLNAFKRETPPVYLDDPRHRQLLAETCYVFGVNPDPRLQPRELLGHRFDPGNPTGSPSIPSSVTIVTAGGAKLKWPIDAETEERLRVIYNCYREDAKTHTRIVLPLPENLTLPRELVDGIVRSSEHQYRTGYLREGGADAAARKARLREFRASGKIPS